MLTNTKEDKPMIHAAHLLWIVPLAASFGCVITAVVVAGARADADN